MLFHNVIFTARTLIVLVAFILGASISPAQNSPEPVAYLAANSLDGCELYPMAVNGELSSPVLLENTICYGIESWNQWDNTRIEIPDGFDGSQPYFLNVRDAVPSPDSSRLAYVRHTAQISQNDNREPGELVILDLQTGESRSFPKPDAHWNVPVWSPDSQTLLSNQHTWEPFETRIEIYDAVEGDSRTAISGIATGNHVQEIWISQDRFLLISWPNIYIGGRGERGTYRFIEIDQEKMDFGDYVNRLYFGQIFWQPELQKLYVNIVESTDRAINERFGMLVSIDLEGRLTKILDYRNVFPEQHKYSMPQIVTIDANETVYFAPDSDRPAIRFFRNGIIGNIPLQLQDQVDFSAYRGETSPDERSAVVKVSFGTTETGYEQILLWVDLATAEMQETTPQDTPICIPHWINQTVIIYTTSTSYWCEQSLSQNVILYDLAADHGKSISLPDGRPFWLIAPQE